MVGLGPLTSTGYYKKSDEPNSHRFFITAPQRNTNFNYRTISQAAPALQKRFQASHA